MVGVVVCLYKLRKPCTTTWFTMVTILSLLGLGIGMFQSILDATQIPHLASVYLESPAIIQHVIITFGIASPAIYIISLGIPGIWFIFMNLLFYKKFSSILVASGIAWGIGSIVTVFAHLFAIVWLIHIIAFIALLGVPLWTCLQANFLLKELKENL